MDDENLKIESIEIYQSRIRLKEPFVISLGLLEFAENVIIRIRTNNGIIGFGECSPFMTIHGESRDTCFIVAQYLAKVLKGKNPLKTEQCIREMDACIFGNSSIKSAFDIALHDIASQNEGVPLYQFLSGNKNKTIVTDYTVSLGEPEKMAHDAQKIKENGFQVIKVKLGGTGEKDIERIQQIRKAVGMEIPIRIDANQGWDTDEAIQTLIAIAPYKIQHCEEPILRRKFPELAIVRKQSPIPIMADESCCDQNDARMLIHFSACDLFNIKLGKSSGILNAQKLIRLAEESEVKIQMGGFLESRLGFTAAAHLALTSENIIHFDFDTPLMFIEDPVIGGITYSKNGVISVPDTPGIGAQIEETYLKSLERVVI